MAEKFYSLIARFPELELSIMRRTRFDVLFGSICADYEEAAKALCHWKSATEVAGRHDAMAARRAREYEGLLDELEAEILTHLGRQHS